MKKLWIILAVLLMAAPSYAGFFNPSAPAFPVNARACEGCTTVNLTTAAEMTPDDDTDDDCALAKAYLTADSARLSNKRYTFDDGEYNCDSDIGPIDNLNNVMFDGRGGATFVKEASFPREYLFMARYARDLTIKGITFTGLTAAGTDTIVNGESGVYCGSCTGFQFIRNTLTNFGDAALRITTSPSDPVLGINSRGSLVTGNTFQDIFQVTMTSNDADATHGGTAGMTFAGNEYIDMDGSLKLCSRTVGADSILIMGEKIDLKTASTSSVGLEICSVSNVTAIGNLIQNSGTWGINVYVNNIAAVTTAWGFQNIKLRYNTLSNCTRGIRVNASNYSNGTGATISAVDIMGNTLDGITINDGTTYAIQTSASGNGLFLNSFIRDNTLKNITNSSRLVLAATGITASNNN
jgi:hypothetical protein